MTNVNFKSIIENLGIGIFSTSFMYTLFILIEKYHTTW